MDKFLASQYENMKLANYQFACFANYTVLNPTNGNDYDGTVNNKTGGELTKCRLPCYQSNVVYRNCCSPRNADSGIHR